jgi:hypothetical protein
MSSAMYEPLSILTECLVKPQRLTGRILFARLSCRCLK